MFDDLGDRGGDDLEAVAAIAGWLAERIDSPAFGAFVAEVDGELAGSGGVSIYDVPPSRHGPAREAYIMSMYTAPEHRGRGVAWAVLQELLRFAREAGGVGLVWLRASPMGRPIYVRAGFEVMDTYLYMRMPVS